MQKSFETAVVTGASSGIGREIAHRLLAGGASTALLSRRRGPLDELAAKGLGGAALVLPADVTSPDSLGSAALAVERSMPQGIDLLVLGAGLAVFGRTAEIPAEQYRRLFATNVLGAIETVRAFLPAVRRRRGTILAIGSIGGRISAPGMAGDRATKFALHGFLDGLRFEEHRNGLRIVEICPGATDTPFFSDVAPKEKMPRSGKMLRMLEPGEVAEAALRAARRGTPRTTIPASASLLAWFNDAFPLLSRPVQRLIEG